VKTSGNVQFGKPLIDLRAYAVNQNQANT